MPSSTWICLAKMIRPIAASMPCTTECGKKSLSEPKRRKPNSTCSIEATTMAPSARCQPWAPPPNSTTAPAQMVISPAAGPLMVSREPANRLTNRPPIIAVNTPMAGGNSLALAMPRLSGSASRKTRKPDTMSLRQFCLSPARPSSGSALGFIRQRLLRH